MGPLSASNAWAQAYETLHRFSLPSDFVAGLVQGSDAAFYGTTAQGGTSGFGTVFKMDVSGTMTVLHAFMAPTARLRAAGLVQGSDGTFYGTTAYGGASNAGTVFKMDGSGTVLLLHSFNYSTDGAYPSAGLVQGNDGFFYGTTYQGGGSDYGTVFRMDSSGRFTLLHSFDYATGAYPSAGLVQGSDGPSTARPPRAARRSVGAVFRWTRAERSRSCMGSTAPTAPIRLPDWCKGATALSTAPPSRGRAAGTVFKMDASGTVTVLHFFDGTDGTYPSAGLVQGSDGAFYGTTAQGRPLKCRNGVQDGPERHGDAVAWLRRHRRRQSACRLVQGTDGAFYGTAIEQAAASSSGLTVAALSMPLNLAAISPQVGHADLTWTDYVDERDAIRHRAGRLAHRRPERGRQRRDRVVHRAGSRNRVSLVCARLPAEPAAAKWLGPVNQTPDGSGTFPATVSVTGGLFVFDGAPHGATGFCLRHRGNRRRSQSRGDVQLQRHGLDDLRSDINTAPRARHVHRGSVLCR